MKFSYKHCCYDTDTMSEKDKEVLKDVIQAFEQKEKASKIGHKSIEQKHEKLELEAKPVNKLPFDKKK